MLWASFSISFHPRRNSIDPKTLVGAVRHARRYVARIHPVVIPAKAGIQVRFPFLNTARWIPAKNCGDDGTRRHRPQRSPPTFNTVKDVRADFRYLQREFMLSRNTLVKKKAGERSPAFLVTIPPLSLLFHHLLAPVLVLQVVLLHKFIEHLFLHRLHAFIPATLKDVR